MTSTNDAQAHTAIDHLSRRQVLGGAAGAAGAIFAAGTAGVAGTLIAPRATAEEKPGVTPRALGAYGAGFEALELEGAPAGRVYRTSGGLPFAEVTSHRAGADTTITKVVSAVRTEPLKIECGTGMSAGWYQWIADTISGQKSPVRKSGAVISYDPTGKAVRQLVFSNALISEVTLPALDASVKDPARLGVTLVPESAHLASAGGAAGPTSAAANQKLWVSSNFALSIDGLEGNTKFVSVDAMAFKVIMAEQKAGKERFVTAVPKGVETPNLVVTLVEAQVGPFYQWFDAFVLKGDASNRRQGTLVYLLPNLKDAIGAVHFHNLGIMKFAPETDTARGIRQVRIEMFCDSMTLDLNKFA